MACLAPKGLKAVHDSGCSHDGGDRAKELAATRVIRSPVTWGVRKPLEPVSQTSLSADFEHGRPPLDVRSGEDSFLSLILVGGFLINAAVLVGLAITS